MLDSRDNSVLKSLKELRKQEEDRVKKEKAEADARAEVERKAKEEAERKVKEELARTKREEDARLQRIEDEKTAREREERLRLEESERKARIDAEMKLQHERMRLEVQAKSAAKAKSAPVGMIVGVAALALVIAGGVILKIKADHQKQLALQQEKSARETETARLREAELTRRVEQIEASYKKQLAEAKSDAERLAIQRQHDEALARTHASSGGSVARPVRETARAKESSAVPAADLIKKKKDVSSDPLDGLKL